MDRCLITLEPDPTNIDVRALVDGLVQFNASRAEAENWQSLNLLLRDQHTDAAVQGGLLGYTHWGWLFVSHLWIAEPLRGQGYGRSLLDKAEEEALARGCRYAHLDTFDFQARDFYAKLGYMVFGQLHDYPAGHTRFFLQKALR
ncbi:MAG TPA: GNAT family N-acetyltransferase [Abditibacteriaceae bacterium]|jgi:GNAT superfamily N-acetyltransferase